MWEKDAFQLSLRPFLGIRNAFLTIMDSDDDSGASGAVESSDDEFSE